MEMLIQPGLPKKYNGPDFGGGFEPFHTIVFKGTNPEENIVGYIAFWVLDLVQYHFCISVYDFIKSIQLKTTCMISSLEAQAVLSGSAGYVLNHSSKKYASAGTVNVAFFTSVVNIADFNVNKMITADLHFPVADLDKLIEGKPWMMAFRNNVYKQIDTELYANNTFFGSKVFEVFYFLLREFCESRLDPAVKLERTRDLLKLFFTNDKVESDQIKDWDVFVFVLNLPDEIIRNKFCMEDIQVLAKKSLLDWSRVVSMSHDRYGMAPRRLIRWLQIQMLHDCLLRNETDDVIKAMMNISRMDVLNRIARQGMGNTIAELRVDIKAGKKIKFKGI